MVEHYASGTAVLPTHVGVFPDVELPTPTPTRPPHARGGVSVNEVVALTADESSPRTWGCFFAAKSEREAIDVLPTHVGVFPGSTTWAAVWQRPPHARGGVSRAQPMGRCWHGSSPRTWGCFSLRNSDGNDCDVLPTHVGVFPRASVALRSRWRPPHARGGVSETWATAVEKTWSSPRTWGCFCARYRGWESTGVLPTHVGVFPSLNLSSGRARRPPHARGGVSAYAQYALVKRESSPRTWGCFYGLLS